VQLRFFQSPSEGGQAGRNVRLVLRRDCSLPADR